MTSPAPRFSDRHRPVVVAAFDGWADAGEAATGAVQHLAEVSEARVVATLDVDDFYDYQVHRPRVVAEAGRRVLVWPSVRVLSGVVDGREVLLVAGPEPSHRWRAFAAAVLATVLPHDPEAVLVLGAHLGASSHARPVPTRFVPGGDEAGPAGVGAALVEAAAAAGLATGSVRAVVPHYLATDPVMAASLALLREVAGLTGLSLPLAALEAAAAEERSRTDAELSDDPELAAHVSELESGWDARPDEEDIAQAVEQYLRRHP